VPDIRLVTDATQFKEDGMRKSKCGNGRHDACSNHEPSAIDAEWIATWNANSVELPTGWHKIYQQTRARFARVMTDGRALTLRQLKIRTDGTFMVIELPTSDRVLLGIARRCEERSRWTCRDCGRVGRVRSLGPEHEEVLCSRCAAPKLVRRGIHDVLYIGAMIGRLCKPVLAKHVPEILRPNFLESARLARATKCGNSGEEDAGMNKDQFGAWLKWLEDINDSIEATQ
jgi:hypothetical protein